MWVDGPQVSYLRLLQIRLINGEYFSTFGYNGSTINMLLEATLLLPLLPRCAIIACSQVKFWLT